MKEKPKTAYMNKLLKTTFAAFSSFALFACAASAATHTFTINLTTAQATVKTGTGSGSGTATYDDVTGIFSWNYTFEGLSGMVNSAHFHGPAAPGVDAGVQVTVVDPAVSPNMGSTSITPAQGADLIKGRWYLNVHTATVPSGEIRGQLVNDNPPASAEKVALEKQIDKLEKKLKKAKKKKQTAKVKKYKKELKKLLKEFKKL